MLFSWFRTAKRLKALVHVVDTSAAMILITLKEDPGEERDEQLRKIAAHLEQASHLAKTGHAG